MVVFLLAVLGIINTIFAVMMFRHGDYGIGFFNTFAAIMCFTSILATI